MYAIVFIIPYAIQETSLHRRALEMELEVPLSSQPTSLQEMPSEQKRAVESRLAEMQKQQQQQHQEEPGMLLEGEPSYGPLRFHISNSFQREIDDKEETWEIPPAAEYDDLEVWGSNRMVLTCLLELCHMIYAWTCTRYGANPTRMWYKQLQEDPKTWSVEQVCEWLELVGLGTYRDIFKG